MVTSPNAFTISVPVVIVMLAEVMTIVVMLGKTPNVMVSGVIAIWVKGMPSA